MITAALQRDQGLPSGGKGWLLLRKGVRAGGEEWKEGWQIYHSLLNIHYCYPPILTSVTRGLLVAGQGLWVYVRMCGRIHVV